jgi:hypothetical protein
MSLLGGIFDAFFVLVAAAMSGAISACALTLGLRLIEKRTVRDLMSNSQVRYSVFLLLPVSILGVGVGYVSGLSRQPAVGNVVPAVLAILGAVSGYLFSKGQKETLFACSVMIGLSLAIVVGFTGGARQRAIIEEEKASISNQRVNADKEKIMLEYRRTIGLEK